MDRSRRQPKWVVASVAPSMRAPLKELLRAWDLALESRSDVWQLAVEISELRSAGLTTVDLHWLLSMGYVQHAVEVTKQDSNRRLFGAAGELQFSDRSCFVLTMAGARLARSLDASGGKQSGPVPFYDIGRRKLWLGDVLVKHLKKWAPEQHKILKAFQRQGWPARIVNPLTRKPADQYAKIHLGEVIKRLNKNLRNPLIRFHGDGSGRGITWEIVTPS